MARTKADYENTVNALYAKANAEGVTPEEKKMLEDKANELMVRHGVEIALDKSSEDKIIREVFSFAAPYAVQKSLLYNAIAKIFRCRIIKSGKNCHLFGFRSDYDKVEFLFSLIINQAFVDLSKLKIPAGVNAKSYKISWWYGFTDEIRVRLEAANEKVGTDTVPEYAVAIFDRDRAVNLEVHSKFPHVTSTTRYYRQNGGYATGKTDGANVNLHNRSYIGGRVALNRGEN